MGETIIYLKANSCASHFVLSEPDYFIRRPDMLSDAQGAGLLLQGLTALMLLKFHPAVKGMLLYSCLIVGESVLVHGASGGTGSLLVKILLSRGVTVYATTTSPSKIDRIKDLGVPSSNVFLSNSEGLAQKIVGLTNGGVHAVFDGVGKDTFNISLSSLRLFGDFISFGSGTFSSL